ncbi:hypothetical protein HJFPF1_04552 [Paramyrothecium foliicola]|nr:hypothetical protein HJFPF1_04552 [Paramyrothecium foliicola]
MVQYTRVPGDEHEAQSDPRRGPVVRLAEGPSRWLRLVSKIAVSLLVISALGMALAYAVPHLAGIISFAPSGAASSALGSDAAMACTPLTGVDAPNITIYRDEPLAPSPLPPSHADSDGEAIVELFQTLGRSTVWKKIDEIKFEGDTFEPEGMVRLGPDRYVVSSGEWLERTQKYEGGAIINGTDRTPGQGLAHLIVFNGKGQRIADATITRPGQLEYHNGGIDWDGKYIWGTAAQYRPNSTASVYKADPATLQPYHVLNYNDHLGGIVHDTKKNRITCLNWGARNASTWSLKDVEKTASSCSHPKPRSVVRNPSYFIDYQDCKWLGHSKFYGGKSVMLCSGVATIGNYNLGGIALVDVETMVPLAEVPIALESAKGGRLTQNPVEVSVEDGRLRLYWMPDQHESTLYIYEAQPDSPFQFGGGPQA